MSRIKSAGHIHAAAGAATHQLVLPEQEMSKYLVNTAKVQAKTVQGIWRHSRIQTTLDLYRQEDGDEALVAQDQFLKALGMPSGAVRTAKMWIAL